MFRSFGGRKGDQPKEKYQFWDLQPVPHFKQNKQDQKVKNLLKKGNRPIQ